jgi:hypothetical protein
MDTCRLCGGGLVSLSVFFPPIKSTMQKPAKKTAKTHRHELLEEEVEVAGERGAEDEDGQDHCVVEVVVVVVEEWGVVYSIRVGLASYFQAAARTLSSRPKSLLPCVHAHTNHN